MKPVQLKKQTLIKFFLNELRSDLKIDYLLYIGADTSDEPVF